MKPYFNCILFADFIFGGISKKPLHNLRTPTLQVCFFPVFIFLGLTLGLGPYELTFIYV
jgi:hypothetical protein